MRFTSSPHFCTFPNINILRKCVRLFSGVCFDLAQNAVLAAFVGKTCRFLVGVSRHLFWRKFTSVKISRDILTFVKQNSEIDQKKIGRSVRFESPDLSSPAPSVQGPTGPKIRPLRLMLWDQTWKFEFDRLEDGSSPIGVRSTLSGLGKVRRTQAGRIFLGCIDADFRKLFCICQYFSRSTRLIHVYTARHLTTLHLYFRAILQMSNGFRRSFMDFHSNQIKSHILDRNCRWNLL